MQLNRNVSVDNPPIQIKNASKETKFDDYQSTTFDLLHNKPDNNVFLYQDYYSKLQPVNKIGGNFVDSKRATFSPVV